MPQLPLTKIVATVGPATASRDQLAALIDAGASVIRMNFSHGTHTAHKAVFDHVREIAREVGRPIAILQDLQGPKLRVGELRDGGPVTLASGAEFRICTTPTTGDADRVSTSYPGLAHDVRPGDQILLDDGNLELRVERIDLSGAHGAEVVTKVVHGGELKPHKGINLPGTVISSPSLTDKDYEDLRLGIELGVDMVALSFVRQPEDIVRAKDAIAALGGNLPLIAKIEKPQAVARLEEIVAVVDGVMVARGDLGVEMSSEAVPLIQKRLIRLANRAGIPVITATQMLESMIESPRPTRAEANDVANAVFDGTDAVMLSGETAVGAYPIEAVRIMGRIAGTVERDLSWRESLRHEAFLGEPVSRSQDAAAAAKAACSLAESLGARAIAVLTETGLTARRVSQARPGIPIVAVTNNQCIANQLALWHGVVPTVSELEGSIDGLVAQVDQRVRELDVATEGDSIVIVGAVPRANGTRSVFVEIHRLI
jgi:pyruvate kinase